MEDERSNDILKVRVQHCYLSLRGKVDPKPSILNRLFQDGVISIAEKSRIKRQPTKEDRCEELLDLLFESSHTRAFIIFLEALHGEYASLVEEITSVILEPESLTNTHSGSTRSATFESVPEPMTLLEQNRPILLRCIDSNCLLLARLQADQILSQQACQMIKSKRTIHSRNEELLKLLKDVTYEQFKRCLSIFNECEQEHVANLLIGEKEGKLPLDDMQYRRLIETKPKLIEIIDSFNTGLNDYLVSLQIVSKVDLDTIKSQTTTFNRNDAIVDAVMRRSTQDFKNFKKALKLTHPVHVADYLQKGLVIGVHVNTSCPEKDEVMSKFLTSSIDKENDTNLANGFPLSEFHRRGLHMVGAKPGQSIIVYFYCNTADAATFLIKSVRDGCLKLALKELLCTFSSGSGDEEPLDIVDVSMDEEEEDLCNDFIQMMANQETVDDPSTGTPRQKKQRTDSTCSRNKREGRISERPRTDNQCVLGAIQKNRNRPGCPSTTGRIHKIKQLLCPTNLFLNPFLKHSFQKTIDMTIRIRKRSNGQTPTSGINTFRRYPGTRPVSCPNRASHHGKAPLFLKPDSYRGEGKGFLTPNITLNVSPRRSKSMSVESLSAKYVSPLLPGKVRNVKSV